MTPRQAPRRGRLALRPVIVVVIALQVLIPAVLLGVRVADPDRGQLPFGWQMHTTCWQSDPPEDCG